MATSQDLRSSLCGQIFQTTSFPKDVDLSGKTIIVTGANTGIGLECAKHLADLKVSRLILGCRSIEKGNKAKEVILNGTTSKGIKVEVWELDLAKYESVVAFGQRVRNTLPRLDGFLANAAVEMLQFTLAEGLETSITVNVISTILLSIAVLPKLRETSAAYNIPTRLTIVGSSVHIFVDQQFLLTQPKGKYIDTFEAASDQSTAVMAVPGTDIGPQYALSKTMAHILARELADRASRPGKNEHVVVNWANPGWCKSELARQKGPLSFTSWLSFQLIARTAEQGSRSLLYALLAGPETHGCFISESRVKPQSEFLRSEKAVAVHKRLWKEFMARAAEISPETAACIE